MKNKNILLLIVVIGALAVAGAYYIFGPSPAAPTPDEQQSIQSETTAEASGNIKDNAADSDTATELETSEVPEEQVAVVPSIVTTPYSVYIGFAADIGTSSADLMDEEVDEVVIGYEWEALPGSQMFATVLFPLWDQTETEYTLQVWNEESVSYEVFGSYPSGEEIEVPHTGLIGTSRFKVTDIDPALRICPGDRSFTWEVRFTFDGSLGLVRTPITQKLPTGEMCQMRNK